MVKSGTTGISVSLEWQIKSNRFIDKLPENEKQRTCCNCCHIKTGTIFLGLVELIAVAFLFVSIVQQLVWKHADRSLCAPNGRWKDCLIFNFSHFNITLAGDYIIGLLMISIMLSVSILLLFYGIITVSPGFLIPHLIVQGFGLIFSLGYFGLYGWSYFYGDLHTQKRHFEFQTFVERMWLASILLIFSAFQCYLFLTVIKCTLYLQMLNNEHRRRTSQFEEVSERVRIAKENGLWRQNSWGGGFQQYKGQIEEEKRRKEKRKDKPVNRVQWDLQKNEEKSISVCPTESSEFKIEETEPTKSKIIVPLDKEPKKPAIKTQTIPQTSKQTQQTKSTTSTFTGESGKNNNQNVQSSTTAANHHKKRKTGDNTSPTRLHKTESTGSNRKLKLESNIAEKYGQETNVSPTTKKKQRIKDTTNGGNGNSFENESPKSHHRHHQQRSKERENRGEHHHKKNMDTNEATNSNNSRSSSKNPSNQSVPVKKVSISAVPPPTTFQFSSGVIS